MHTPIELANTTTVMLGQLLLAILLGGIVGTERAVIAKQVAGTRTFGLVALASCLFIVITNYVDTVYLGIDSFQPLQLAAGVVTGIGFIGGGLIIFRGDTVHGITTAAGLWMVTAIGMAVGFGLYSVAIFATLLTLAMTTGMWYVENRFKHWFTEHENHSGITTSATPPTLV
jgi:putative Mg2+ transporter-C (MgtC) family protein